MRAVSLSSLALAVLVTITGCEASDRGGGFDGSAPGDPVYAPWGFDACGDFSCVEALDSCQKHVPCTELADCIYTAFLTQLDECYASNQEDFGENESDEATARVQAVINACCVECSTPYGPCGQP